MQGGIRHDFPHLGVEIEIPDNLTVRQYNPPQMENLDLGSGTFTPFRMVIDFDVYDRGKKTQILSPVELRVYFTRAEYEHTNGSPKLAFWNEKLDPPDWEIIPSTPTVFTNAQWTGRGISYFGYLEATHSNWGDPPLALGE